MRLASRLDDFIAVPLGRFFVAPTFLFWCYDPSLRGCSVWGRPSEADVAILVRLMADRRAMRLPYDVVIDVRRLDSIDTLAFEPLLDYARQTLLEDFKLVRRRAIVHGMALPGFLAAGFAAIHGEPSRWGMFNDLRKAFIWLGRADGVRISDMVERLVDQTVNPHPILAPVRAFVTAHLVTAEIEQAAKAAGVSARTLQRLLKSAGTSFRDELERARMAEARRLLADTSLKIGLIARHVGYTSPQRFAALFRRHEGESPSCFRARYPH